jgi:3-hydroxyisobutyrate dehydrogenase
MTHRGAVGVIGIGSMGRPIALRLAQSGYRVSVLDSVPEAVDAVCAEASAQQLPMGSVVPVRCVQAMVECSGQVVLMLPSSVEVEAVVTGAGTTAGILQFAPSGFVIVDMSSSSPTSTRRLAATARARGVGFVDAPVSGGVDGARDGSLTIMAGGTTSDIDNVEPVLAALGVVTRAGGPGSGHAVKALNNYLNAAAMLATAEALDIGLRFGIEPRTFLDIVNASSGRSWSSEGKFPRYVLSESYDSGFALALLAKDVAVAAALGASLGVRPSFLRHCADEWAQASRALAPSADHTEIARWVRERSLPDEP